MTRMTDVGQCGPTRLAVTSIQATLLESRNLSELISESPRLSSVLGDLATNATHRVTGGFEGTVTRSGSLHSPRQFTARCSMGGLLFLFGCHDSRQDDTISINS